VFNLFKSTWIISFICRIMRRLLLLHFVFDYTQNGKLKNCTIKRPWWPLNSSAATKPHSTFFTNKCMKIAHKMGWSYILHPDRTY
jgi:hypothetical protein